MYAKKFIWAEKKQFIVLLIEYNIHIKGIVSKLHDILLSVKLNKAELRNTDTAQSETCPDKLKPLNFIKPESIFPNMINSNILINSKLYKSQLL